MSAALFTASTKIKNKKIIIISSPKTDVRFSKRKVPCGVFCVGLMYAKATNGIKQVKHAFTINRYLYMNMQNLSAGGKSFGTSGSFLVYEQSGFGCMQVKSLHGGHKRLSI